MVVIPALVAPSDVALPLEVALDLDVAMALPASEPSVRPAGVAELAIETDSLVSPSDVALPSEVALDVTVDQKALYPC